MTWYLPDDVLMPRPSGEDARSESECEAVGHGATVICTWGNRLCYCPWVALFARNADTTCESRSLPATLHILF